MPSLTRRVVRKRLPLEFTFTYPLGITWTDSSQTYGSLSETTSTSHTRMSRESWFATAMALWQLRCINLGFCLMFNSSLSRNLQLVDVTLSCVYRVIGGKFLVRRSQSIQEAAIRVCRWAGTLANYVVFDSASPTERSTETNISCIAISPTIIADQRSPVLSDHQPTFSSLRHESCSYEASSTEKTTLRLVFLRR